ncbi:uncharacterized protein LOC101850869 [Aplysia californica]|uniref:Uncharacterized protein LOC101850869 n=1 Tax=Aplysia californica TaxID=6500 RepID=A0ABM0JF80_APLCA|nr:uncharacterized protein LOC101850869 [Aplysia californica]
MEHYIEKVKSYLPKDEKEIEWWIKFRNPKVILKNHESFLYCEIVFYVIGFLTFCHAMRSGGRFRWMWFATIAHGLTVECVSYYVPDIDSFWHAQSMVMLLGQRLPLHILLVYPAFIYTACVAVSHLNLRWWAEPFAVGLTVVLVDVPFDIMGIKLLWWTWHDDDPNIYDRHYWVPWTSYYFHAAFASSFTFLFFGQRSLLCRSGLKYQSSGFFCELPMLIVTGLFSMVLGTVQFIPIYHPLHDSLGIHSEVCVLMLLVTYALIVWSADRYPFESARISGTKLLSLIPLAVLIHYAFYIYLVFTAKPNTIRSIGYHQPVGPCDEPVKVLTPFGHVLQKNKYLCLERFYEDYFDLKCVKKRPADKTEWYTVCGTGYENHAEYVVVVCAFCALGLYWFWQLLYRSGSQPRTKSARAKQHRD